jgi:hypothetical protein
VDDDRLPEPSFRRILLGGLPRFARDGFVPVGAFYLAWRLGGLGAGIAASTAASALLWRLDRRLGRDNALLRLSFAFVLVQAAVGLVSHSEVVYLAQPVVANGIWALAFLGSAAAGRPLAGTFARAWYPFTDELLRSRSFRRVYGFESVVWGVYLLARSGLRLWMLLSSGVGGFVVVSFATGTPAGIALMAWSVWYATRRLPAELEREFAPA